MRERFSTYQIKFFSLLGFALLLFCSCENFVFGGNLREQLTEDMGTTYTFYEYADDNASKIKKVYIIGKDISEKDFPKYEHEDTLLVGWQYFKNSQTGSTEMPSNMGLNYKNYISTIRVSPNQESLYAIWKTKCTVTFVTNCEEELEPVIIAEGDYLEWPQIDYRRGSWRLWSWFLDPEFTQQFSFDRDPVMGDITLYAKWVEVAEITFYKNDDSGEWSTYEVEKNENFRMPDCMFGEREDYGFVGWSTTEDGGAVYYSGDDVPGISSDIELFAVWSSDIVTLTYVDRDGQFATRYAKFGRGAHATVGRILNDEERWYDSLANIWEVDGKDLVGYSTSQNDNIDDLPYDRWGGYHEGDYWRNYIVVNENYTFYVYFKNIEFTVRFYYDDLTGSRRLFGEPVTVTWNQKLTRPAAVPIIAGHTFENWYRRFWMYGQEFISPVPFNFNTIFNDDTFEGDRYLDLIAKFTLGGNSTGGLGGGISFEEESGSDIVVNETISGSNITFTVDTSSGSYSSYTWYLNDVEQSSYSNSPTITFNTSGWTTGYYDVRLVASRGSDYYSWQGTINK